MIRFQLIGLVTFLFFLSSCRPYYLDPVQDYFAYPQGFPGPEIPEDNLFTQERWELGRRLFFDPIMSIDGSKSCASCHKAEFAFGDQSPTSSGVFEREGIKNVPPLFNLAYHPYFTQAGGVPTLEMQILVPIQEHNEFSHNIVKISEILAADSSYSEMSQLAYKRPPDPFVITRALANFERSLVSGNSPYDQYFYQGNEGRLSKDEKRGMELFFSERLECSNCHSGFNFTNYSFENNGQYSDSTNLGRFLISGIDSDKGKFKVPSLRNLKYTAPYMHDGEMETLDEVLSHYNRGGDSTPNKSTHIKKLNLKEVEMNQLKLFLLSLSDVTFIDKNLTIQSNE